MNPVTCSIILGMGIALGGCGSPPAVGGTGGTAGGGSGGFAGTGGAGGWPNCPTTCDEARTSRPPLSGDWPCSRQKMCDTVPFRADLTPPYELANSAAARCALEALRDGTEGFLEWAVEGKLNPEFSERGQLTIRPGRTVLLSSRLFRDKDHHYDNGAGALQDALFFNGCLAETDGTKIYDCLKNAVIRCSL
jgi:hypothetical protein